MKTKPSAPLDTARTSGSTKAAYKDFYQRLKTQLNTKNIPPQNITNMDKHSIQEVQTRAKTVIGDSAINKSLITSSKSKT